MAKHHSTISRREFMKILGLGGVGLGAAAAAGPIFHDLDEVLSSPQADFKRPSWVKEVDKPTVDIEWGMIPRWDPANMMWAAGLLKALGQKQFEWVFKLKAANEAKWLNENKAGYTLRDFALVFVRTLQEGEQLLEVNHNFEEAARRGGFYCEELMEKLACGSKPGNFEGVPCEIKKLFVTALEIESRWHVRMQSVFQKYTDNAISKTVNLPSEATPEDITAIYMMAYEEGLKGITVYRGGSRRLQPLSTNGTGLQLMCKRLRLQGESRVRNAGRK